MDERKGEEKINKEDYAHIRNKFTRKAIEALSQARRCEQFAHRLEMRRLGKGKDVHSKLNKDALFKIVKTSRGKRSMGSRSGQEVCRHDYGGLEFKRNKRSECPL